MAELSSQPTSVQSAYGWHSEERLYVNRRYQRKLVWTLVEKQKLIGSIMKKYPIPAILLAEQGDGTARYEIIDGLQRLNAIVSFIEGAFPTEDGRYFDISQFPTAKTNWENGKYTPNSQENLISSKEVSVILDYALAFSIMRNASNDEVDDVFDRINSYGHRLSEQERRQSGSQNEFSDMVRSIACKIRGDESQLLLPLSKMPEISIDLPMTKHGYDVKAEDVFWVEQGILKSTDLRDSMDEQCIADIAASIIGGTVLERAKDVLDKIYERNSEESIQLLSAMAVYGVERFVSEFEYCVSQIELICEHGGDTKLRDIIFEHKNTNAFPAVFSVIFIAFHEIMVGERKSVNDYDGLKKAVDNLNRRIDTSRKSTSSEERRKNIDIIKALISPHFSNVDPSSDIYANHSAVDIDNYIRSTGMELSRYELKQGLLELDTGRKLNSGLLSRLIQTACGIANNGPERAGRIILGVANEEKDAERIVKLDGIRARRVGSWHVVGIDREAKALGISLEAYHNIIRTAFQNSDLSDPLKTNILSSIDYNAYYGLGVIVISILPQKEPSYVGEEMYWRDGDNTKIAKEAKLIAEIGRRF
ncbi:DUF262 domain-containing protein [Beijerinckia mobilis]|uniref:DUF262 domain-containing protein n=1 Tax=Beijerinckia mobilis TaxID=231434 RepID=UPI00055995BA|nr:DUF262 domain-containing protein [Beijerinckia mobilis]